MSRRTPDGAAPANVPGIADAGSLRSKADWVRRQTLLLHRRCPETRLASSLSCVEILTVLYYGGIVSFDSADPAWKERDRFIISKGHGSISFYPILADLGFFPMGELDLISRPEGLLKVIPDTTIPGYETINGSVGQGLGVACGLALALRRRNMSQKVFVLSGDGELNEGSVWEAIMFAAHHKLGNLVMIIDNNGACMLDYCRNIIDLSPLDEKFRVFRWECRITDGHDVEELHKVLHEVKGSPADHPKVVIANTIKGKGVPSLENDSLSHIRMLKADEIDRIIGEGR
jgi:transketolase